MPDCSDIVRSQRNRMLPPVSFPLYTADSLKGAVQQFPLLTNHKKNKATERAFKIKFRKLLQKLQYHGVVN